MDPIESEQIFCPYCGQAIDLTIDYSAGSQEYTEDCAVCCRPILVSVKCNRRGESSVNVRQENE